MNLSDDPSLAHEFVVESLEMIDQVEPQLVEISDNIDGSPLDNEVINTIFRLFHSMKGSAGFMNLNVVQTVAHEAENLLDQVRQGKMPLTERHVDLLIRTCDFLRDLMDKIGEHLSDSMAKDDADIFTSELKLAVEESFEAGPEKSPAAGRNPARPDQAAPAAKGGENPYPGEEGGSGEASLDLQKLMGPFIQEGNDLLDAAEEGLLNLKKDSDNSELLADTIRQIHTFKGNCGMMGHGEPEKLSHMMETMLELCQEETLPLSEENVDLLLSMVDVLRLSLSNVGEGGRAKVPNLDIFTDLIKDKIQLAAGKEAADKALEAVEMMAAGPRPIPEELGSLPMEKAPGLEEPSPEVSRAKAAPAPEPPAETIIGGQAMENQFNESGGNPSPVIEEPAPEPGGTEAQPPSSGAVAPSAPLKSGAGAGQKPSQAMRQDIRVDVKKLDILFDLVGELIIAESMVTHAPELEHNEFSKYNKDARHLTKITRELHEITMSVRMVPVSGVFRKMKRLVHDLAHKSGKEVDLVLVGEETEVDKSVNELISDPLVHMIRNAMDHGIETREERLASGKVARGKITVEARHEGNEVWISASDDGNGLDRNKLLRKGIEKGLVEGDGSDLTEDEVFNLIFEPGFSTAEKVTNISGRGVGMDVVRRNVEKIKGRIDVKSVLGQGTQVILRIPLTLAIVEGMLVMVSDSLYMVPILSITETIKITKDQITKTMDGEEIVKIRGDLFPVLRLHELHSLEPKFTKLEDGILLVMEHEDKKFCLFVDSLEGMQQTVIKGFSGFLSSMRGVSGCAILGDGDVSLILDIGSLLKIPGTIPEVKNS